MDKCSQRGSDHVKYYAGCADDCVHDVSYNHVKWCRCRSTITSCIELYSLLDSLSFFFSVKLHNYGAPNFADASTPRNLGMLVSGLASLVISEVIVA